MAQTPWRWGCCQPGHASAWDVVESHQVSPWRQGLAGQVWKPLRKLVGEEGFHGGHQYGVLLEGSQGDDAQGMAALLLWGLTLCPGVLQTLCLNV